MQSHVRAGRDPEVTSNRSLHSVREQQSPAPPATAARVNSSVKRTELKDIN